MFRVGMKVVCISSGWVANGGCVGDTILPERGSVYTVRWIGPSAIGSSGTFIRLHEIHNRLVNFSDGPMEAYFEASFFRPIVERKTDISIFREILRRASKPSPVKAFENSSWFGG
jgi:hypothetical protein